MVNKREKRVAHPILCGLIMQLGLHGNWVRVRPVNGGNNGTAGYATATDSWVYGEGVHVQKSIVEQTCRLPISQPERTRVDVLLQKEPTLAGG